MKIFAPLLWLAILAAVIAGVVVLVGNHSSPTGLHENTEPHVDTAGILFFYWWGGIVAAGSPLIYIYLWRKTRQLHEHPPL